MSEHEVIQPRKVALGATSDSTSRFRFKYVWMSAALCLVVFSLVALIMLAPEAPIQEPVPLAQTKAPATQSTRAAEAPTPLQIERQKRALEESNEIVKRFAELEIQLEDEWNVLAWGEQAFNEARGVANEAERAFAESAYEEAIEGYAQGVSSLEKLLSEAESHYQQALFEAINALNARDATGASSLLDEAALYQPSSAMVEAARRRLENLDEVIALLGQAAEAESGGAFDDAIGLAERARKADPSTEGIADYLRRLRQSSLEARFKNVLAQGYAALDQQEYERAEESFRNALQMKPDDLGAQQGLDQAITSRANRNIQAGLAEAAGHSGAEDWEQAILAFDQVRQIDPSLSEAIEGMANARMRKELDDALRAMISAPGRLADDRQFAKAKALLAESRQISPAGAKLTQQQETLAEQIIIASQLAQLVLLSDSETDVRLQYRGDLGRFQEKILNLRPGRYLIQGGRDGYREVRMELDVAPGMQRFEIVCTERI